MADNEKAKAESEVDVLTVSSSPLVFISHDSRDGELAEAFSKLLRSVSAGMIKTFRSSDRKGTEGIDFGEEWYKRLMTALQSTSDVVCLFTERSIDRPWILFEAGVAKGKLDTPVFGIALGVQLSRISAGPFYQFQNMDDSEGDLIKLVNQLARRVAGLELDPDVVKTQVTAFKTTEAEILKKIGSPIVKKGSPEVADDSVIAKLAEEMKALPARVAERLSDLDEPNLRRRRRRRIHPMMFEEIMHVSGGSGDPVSILMAASIIREDAPWLYELAMEVYRTIKSGNPRLMTQELDRLRRIIEMTTRGPLAEEFGVNDKETYMLLREFPRMLHHVLAQLDRQEKPVTRRRPPRISPKE